RAKKLVDRNYRVQKARTAGNLRVEHAVDDRGQKSRRDSFTGNIDNDRGEGIGQDTQIEEIAAHLLAGDAAPRGPGKIALDLRFADKAALNGGSDVHLLAILPRSLFGLHEARAFQGRRTFTGQRAKNVMTYSGEVARHRAAVQIEHSLGFSGLLLTAGAQGKGNHGPQFVDHDTFPPP